VTGQRTPDAPAKRGTDRRVLAAVVGAVLVIWLVGAAVTRYSLEQMALFAPIAVVVVGATIAIVLLWVKIVLQLRDERRARRQS
jgi:membrane protein YdbS with pleckstrin-like domain